MPDLKPGYNLIGCRGGRLRVISVMRSREAIRALHGKES